MKKIIRLLMPLVLIALLTVSLLSAISLSEIRGFSKLINYVGIVRGASQRVIKLETNGRTADDLIVYVSNIMDELLGKDGQYGLIRTNHAEFNENLEVLSQKWNHVKKEIQDVRSGVGRERLLDSSEELFAVANDTVFSIEDYSEERSAALVAQMFVMGVVCLLFFIGVLIHYFRKYFALRKKTEVLEDKAGRDKLTGALNAERFNKDGDKIIASNPNDKFAVLYIDFENFKYINDIFGYEQGDQILRKYAALAETSLGEKELFSRIMADRFQILRCYKDKDDLLKRQRELDDSFMKLCLLPGRHTLSLACGFCCVEDVIEQLGIEGLLDRANYAQKTVKNKSMDKYAFYDEGIRNRMFREMRIKNQMENALHDKEFLVYLQPKVSPYDNQIKSAEALVRWRTSDGQFLTPDQFIPVFEKNRQISAVDQYVFEEVCRFLHDRLVNGLTVLPISVNVSKTRFYTSAFVETYTEIKSRYQIPDNLLEVEFTETVACESKEYMLEIVESLHKNGFLCSMDDFGTGYSSLGMLNDIPIDVLKLDALFFRPGSDLAREQLIVQNILKMIQKLNIRTVAEGIEDKEQVEFLKTNGCDLIQGYYYYKPMPMEDFAKLLKHQHTMP